MNISETKHKQLSGNLRGSWRYKLLDMYYYKHKHCNISQIDIYLPTVNKIDVQSTELKFALLEHHNHLCSRNISLEIHPSRAFKRFNILIRSEIF